MSSASGATAGFPARPDNSDHKRHRSMSEVSGNPAPHVSPCLPAEEPADDSRPSRQADPVDIPVEASDDTHSTSSGPSLLTFSEWDLQSQFVYLSNLETHSPEILSDSDLPELVSGFVEACSYMLDMQDTSVEFAFEFPLAYWVTECPAEEVCEGSVLVFKVDKHKTEAVIDRESRALSKEELVQYAAEVDAAKFVELKKWHDLQTFRRFARKDATNVLDGRWVINWKEQYVAPKVEGGKPTFKWSIKARLTARGFKDVQAFNDNIATYSGTANKASQRIICAQAAQSCTVLWSMDIGSAFLKGISFAEIAKKTGTPLRSVQFDFPAKDVHLLQLLPGM